MIRGDTSNFPFKIKQNGQYITDGNDFDEIEVQFNSQDYLNSIKKLKSRGDVVWSNDHFNCALTQEETFKLPAGLSEVQVRLLKNNVVKATLIKTIDVGDALSKEIL